MRERETKKSFDILFRGLRAEFARNGPGPNAAKRFGHN